MRRFMPMMLLLVLGCAPAADTNESGRTQNEPHEFQDGQWKAPHQATEPSAEVMIDRVGEQIIGVRAVKGDVKVLDDVPPATEKEYVEKYHEAPKRFIFSQTSLQFYTYGRGGARITLKSTDRARGR